MTAIEQIHELVEHLGPGPHPGGSPQGVHGGKGGGAGQRARMSLAKRPAAAIMALLNENGAFTVKLGPNGQTSSPKTGLMVSIRSSAGHGIIIPGGKANARQVQEWVAREMPFLGGGKDRHLGGWKDEDGTLYLDVSRRLPESQLDRAMRLGVKEGQIAIFRLSDFTEIPTGGTGRT